MFIFYVCSNVCVCGFVYVCTCVFFLCVCVCQVELKGEHLNVAKILESGKKQRKNWTLMWSVLTSDQLLFYKERQQETNQVLKYSIYSICASASSLLCLYFIYSIFNSVLFIQHQVTTKVISSHFTYRAGLDRSLYNVIYRDPVIPTTSKHLVTVARKNFL